jgi:hypothetical protein
MHIRSVAPAQTQSDGMTNPYPPLPPRPTPPLPSPGDLPTDPPPGHCGLAYRHITHRFLLGHPPLVYRCSGAPRPPVGLPVRTDDPHWLSRAGFGAPW